MEITASESEFFSNRSGCLGNLVSMSLATNVASEKESTCFQRSHVIGTDGKIENPFCSNAVVLKLVVTLL